MEEPKENSELLNSNSRQIVGSLGSAKKINDGAEEVVPGPPDGGFRAITVVIGSFLTNGLLFGVINCYSVIYEVLLDQLNKDKVENAESRAALVGSLTMGTTFALSPLSGVLTDLMGIRLTAIIGGSIATISLLLSSFFVKHVDVLCFTYGVLYGLGASLAYTPSLAILGHYFKKHLGIVNGVVTVGSSVFTVIMPPLMSHVIMNYGLDWLFRVLAVFTIGIALCGFLFTPTPLMLKDKPIREDNTLQSFFRNIVNVYIWKNMLYRLWALSIPIALFGYFVNYVHIREFIKTNFTNVNIDLPLQCMAITSGFGRIVIGFLADRPGVDRICLQQISFYVIGTLTIILPFLNSFALVVVACLGIGIVDGAFIALIGPIAFELCGEAYAAQAIGCMLGLTSVPLTIGPMVAGYIYSVTKSYTLPFVLAGISPLVGATLMFSIHVQRRRKTQSVVTNGHAYRSSADIEKVPVSVVAQNGDANQQTAL